MFQIASDLRFAIRITNRNRSQIARFGALRFLGFWRVPTSILEAEVVLGKGSPLKGGHFGTGAINPPYRAIGYSYTLSLFVFQV